MMRYENDVFGSALFAADIEDDSLDIEYSEIDVSDYGFVDDEIPEEYDCNGDEF